MGALETVFRSDSWPPTFKHETAVAGDAMQGRTLGSRANRWLRALAATDHPARGTAALSDGDGAGDEPRCEEG